MPSPSNDPINGPSLGAPTHVANHDHNTNVHAIGSCLTRANQWIVTFLTYPFLATQPCFFFTIFSLSLTVTERENLADVDCCCVIPSPEINTAISYPSKFSWSLPVPQSTFLVTIDTVALFQSLLSAKILKPPSHLLPCKESCMGCTSKDLVGSDGITQPIMELVWPYKSLHFTFWMLGGNY